MSGCQPVSYTHLVGYNNESNKNHETGSKLSWIKNNVLIFIAFIVVTAFGKVSYINISRDYADDIEAQAVKTGLQPFRTDLNVMLASKMCIRDSTKRLNTELGKKIAGAIVRYAEENHADAVSYTHLVQ